MIFRLSLAILSLLMLTAHGLAHPGHGVNPAANDPIHYVAEPVHFLPWLAVFAIVVFAVRFRKSVRRTS
jgi:hypothetical protein